MMFSITATFVSLVALASALAVEDPTSALVRKTVLDLEARNLNMGRAVTTGACCSAGVSKKEDVCTTAAGATGKCVPANSAGCKLPGSPFPLVKV